MSATTDQTLADHMAADLACQFARRHAAQGRHAHAAQCYSEAVQLYSRCGCDTFAAVALADGEHELELARLYR